MDKNNNWFKLFALMIVGGVAKTLFGPPPVVRPINQYIDAAKELRSDSTSNDDSDKS